MKKMSYHFKILFENHYNLAVFLIGYTFILVTLFLKCARFVQGESLDLFYLKMYVPRYAYLHFPIMCMLTLNFFNLSRRVSIQETLSDKRSKLFFEQLYTVTIVNAGVFLSIALTMIVFAFYKISDINLHSNFIFSLVFQIFVDYFLVGIFSILIGILISEVKIKQVQVIIFILFQFIFGYPLLWISRSFNIDKGKNSIVHWLLELSAVLPDGFQTDTDGYGVYPIQPHRIILITMWIVIFFIIIFGILYTRKKAIVRIMGLLPILLLCAAIFFLFPHTTVASGYRLRDCYQNMHEEIYQKQGMETDKALFEVSAYDIEFNVYFCMFATVNMDVNVCNLDKYTFTLLKDYKVTKVEDQKGNSLEFSQDGYYFTVYSEGADIEKIRVSYYGAAMPFYTDMSSMFLQQGVPFIPMAGKVPIYSDEGYGGIIYYANNHLPQTTISLKVNTIGKVYCSLPRVKGNYFEGEADGFFVLKGMVGEICIEDTTFIFPLATEYGCVILDKEVSKDFLERVDKIMIEHEKEKLSGKTVLLDWMYGKSRLVEQYSNFTTVNSFYINDSLESGWHKYLEFESEKMNDYN